MPGERNAWPALRRSPAILPPTSQTHWYLFPQVSNKFESWILSAKLIDSPFSWEASTCNQAFLGQTLHCRRRTRSSFILIFKSQQRFSSGRRFERRQPSWHMLSEWGIRAKRDSLDSAIKPSSLLIKFALPTDLYSAGSRCSFSAFPFCSKSFFIHRPLPVIAPRWVVDADLLRLLSWSQQEPLDD